MHSLRIHMRLSKILYLRLLKKLSFLIGICTLFIVNSSYAYQIIGIHDGDTLTLLVDHKPLKIRLANIDAPELKQAFGQKSKKSLSDLCWGKDAQYETQAKDRYGRTVAVVKCDGREANRHQVEMGLAWVYTKYNKDMRLTALEQTVRLDKLGLWNDSDAVAPWKFRHRGSPK